MCKKDNKYMTKELYQIITETTRTNKTLGEEYPKQFDKVDMLVFDVLVDRDKARIYKNDLIRILDNYPQPKRLSEGPAYIELAAYLELTHRSTLKLMALGQTLEFWEVFHGRKIGLSDTESLDLATKGFIMVSGYNPNGKGVIA